MPCYLLHFTFLLVRVGRIMQTYCFIIYSHFSLRTREWAHSPVLSCLVVVGTKVQSIMISM
ncbi:hypothetical protein B0F90DRAFT_1690519, partial [Multifurca ochricompacta]